MTDSNCIICFEALSSAPLGAAVPCGHCFHQNCFAQWQASCARGGARNVTCPMCNSKRITFTNLFLDLQPEEDDDDDDSLSSASSVESEKKATSDAAVDATEAPDERGASDDAQAPQEGEERVERRDEVDSDETDRPDVIEIDLDDNSVVEILSDGTSSPPPKATTKNKRKRSTPNTQTSDKGGDAARIRRKAKRLKKKNKFLESQREEFVDRERKLLEDFSKTRKRLEELEHEQEAREEGAKGVQRELEGYRVRVARLTRERDTANGEMSAMRERTAKAEADFDEIKARCREDVKNAQSRAMQEVKVMADRQPKLIQENHDLKELMVKKDHQIKVLKQKLETLNECVQERAEKEIVKQRVSGKKHAKSVAREYQEAQEERMRQEEEARARKQAAAASRPTKAYSAQAARFSVAARKVTSKQNSAMDILGSAPRRKDGKSSATRASHAHRRRSEESRESTDEAAVLGGMSLNVSSTKRRKIEPLPLGKAGAKKPARKETNMLNYFARNGSRR